MKKKIILSFGIVLFCLSMFFTVKSAVAANNPCPVPPKYDYYWWPEYQMCAWGQDCRMLCPGDLRPDLQ